MRKLRRGALLCGLGLLLSSALQAGVARADAPAPVPPAAPAPAAGPASVPRDESPHADGTYLVRYRTASALGAGRARLATVTDGSSRVLGSSPTMIARLSPAEAEALADDPDVAYVQKDTTVRVAGTQTQPPWGLDRLDEATLPLDGRFTANRSGAGVTVYVVDTGISPTADFGNRLAAGKSFIDDGFGTADCYGHGTHVAGTIGGTVYGVAKKVTLVPVRVLDCGGTGTSADTVRGLDWVAKDHRSGVPAVVNLSLTGDLNRAENDMVAALVAEGVTVVAAAGNSGANACSASPGAAPAAITVAASDAADQRASFSDYGTCVDVYAPGVDVVSVSAAGGSTRMSGTSMATPHVAGVAALLLDAHPSWSPAKVSGRVLKLALRDQIGANPSGTPNLLVNIAPTLTSASPAKGGQGGGEVIRLTGGRFLGVTAVLFDGIPASGVRVGTDATTLTARAPAHAPGAVTVVVVSELSASNTAAFTYLPSPLVTTVSPDAGSVAGGDTVTINGSRFTDATAVSFGAHPAASFTVVSDTEIRAISPTGGTGTVDVRVANAAGNSSSGPAARFTYGRLARVRTLSPSAGLTIGGTRITLRGTHFSSGIAVLFGGVPGTSVSVRSSTRLRVTVPAHAAGTVDVRAINRFGMSLASASSRFTFREAAAPGVAGLSPRSGYAVGGTTVTITGSRFYGVRSVTFGRTAATIVSTAATRLVVRAPAHAVGPVDVRVVGAYGSSPAGAVGFTYRTTPAPRVAKVSPSSGSRKGGTVVTLTGSNFYAVSAVTFGGSAGTRLTVVSSTKLRVTTPAHTKGRVDVVVSTDAGLVSSPAHYTFT